MRGLRKVQPKKLPKPRPGLDDPAHKARVKTLRCLIAGRRVTLGRWAGTYPKQWIEEEYVHVCEGPVDPHHTEKKSQLGHDHSTVPLCRTAHNEAHRLGNRQFKEVWKVDLEAEARKLAPKGARRAP
jgi:hypothetical protein